MKAQEIFQILEKEAATLWKYIENYTVPEETDELHEYFSDDYFDVITWVNTSCLEATPHDLLLATGGPAYGVCLIHNHPYYWFQDWFQSKEFLATDRGTEFYEHIFETIKEMEI